jgi:integrase
MKRAAELFDSVKSFEDLERTFLKGAGLSENSYRSYLTAVRQFYEHTGGLHPLKVRAADIEDFYDHLVERVGRSTARLRILGLKRFFRGVEEAVPFFRSPFTDMEDRLVKKIARSDKAKRGKALTAAETRRLLELLEKDTTVLGLENLAIVKMLLATGLRAAELCGLRWKDLEHDEDTGTWYACGTGKGSKPFRQEIAMPGVVEAAERYFRAHLRRRPRPEDAVFWSMETNPKDPARPLSPNTLFLRIRRIGEKAKAAGAVTREVAWSPHLFRRTCGTLLDKARMSPVSIQHFLRHSSLATTAKHYILSEEPAAGYFKKLFEVPA